jgi:hypothetical protein
MTGDYYSLDNVKTSTNFNQRSSIRFSFKASRAKKYLWDSPEDAQQDEL